MSLRPETAFTGTAFVPHGTGEKPAILIVDDEPQLVTAMTDALDEHYDVMGETSPVDALKILRGNREIHVIISDQRMPVMTGDEFLFRAKEISSATRILATAYADLGAVVNAVNRGKIFNYLRKPWDGAELRSVVDTAAQHYALSMALRQERALLKSIMDCSLDAISVKDANHRYVHLNNAEAAMLGAGSPGEVFGKSHAELISAPRAALWNEEEAQLFDTAEALRDRIEHFIAEDGTEHWCAANKAPIKSANGAPIGLVSVTRDVTASKSIEQIKDDFIATARHELRTPLTVISSSIKLMRTGRFGPITLKQEDLLLHGEQHCDRLIRLVNHMLDIQDLTAGRANLNMAPVALLDLVEECRDIVAVAARDNEVTIRIDGSIPEAPIVADRDRLLQAVCNLLFNACKFSPPGAIVTVTVLDRQSDVRISVEDRGAGIPPTFAKELFKSFSQRDSSTTRQHQGAGLGLRVCKAIAEAHGGEVGFLPPPDGGAIFYLTLPRRVMEAAHDY
jgi:two-component system cell cycle sensor histidine kinase PleC